jgi:hypothetical protein
MASVILGNGNVTFGDGTSMTTNTVPYTNVSNRKTTLSQFVNDLGNYGSFLSTGLVSTAAVGTGAFPNIGVRVTGSGASTTLSIYTDGNCNCNCACNC